jgi:hypothetical protein
LKLIIKQALINFGWTIDECNDTDYYELMSIMSAKEAEDRVVDPLSLL